jgi:hypothetical protein
MSCKVLQTKLWATQIVIRVAEEPVCVSRGPGRSVLVATRLGWMELHVVAGGRSHLRFRFRTVCSRIHFLALLPTLLGDSIVTVEALREGSEMQALRVYSHWRRPEPVCVSVSLPSTVDALACCEAGRPRVLVATANGLILYHCDGGAVLPVLDLAAAGAHKLALHGDFVGWTVGPLVHVLRVQVAAADEEGAAGTAVPPPPGPDVVLEGGVGMAGRLLVPSLARDAAPFVATGPFPNLTVGVKADEGWRVLACDTVLLQRTTGSVHSLRFATEPDVSSCSLRRHARPKALVRCLVSTAEAAWLFSLSQPALLTRYSYASPTFMAVADGCFLYALQAAPDRAGAALVEVFSLRPSEAALPVRDMSGDLDDWTVVRSSAGGAVVDLPPPCMMASLPFVGLQAVASIKAGAVALMSKMLNGDDAFWSVSVLFPERAVEIWRELAGKAAPVRVSDPDTFLLFHLEGLLVLGARLCMLAAEHSPLDTSVMEESASETTHEEHLLGDAMAAPLNTSMPDDPEATRSLFLESCRVMGDFCESRRLFDSAAVFWGMSQLPVDEVTRRLLPERQAAAALVEYVNRALADNDARLSAIGTGVGNSLIEHLAKHRPAELPRAILTCSMAFDPTLAVGLLVRVGSAEETFARAYALALVGHDRSCLAALRSLDSTVLLQLLETYETAWSSGGGGGLTPFGRTLLGACGFSVLEAVARRGDAVAPRQAALLLGGSSAPLFLAYLEQVLERDPPAAAAHRREAAELLAAGYAQRCVTAALTALPPDWSAMVDQFAGMRLVDPSQAPLEIRWALRHWRGLFRAARPPWLDSVAPMAEEGAARTHFYVGKLQTLLLALRRVEGARAVVAAALESKDDPRLNEWCRVFWLPELGRLPEALRLVFAAFSNEACLGFCAEFCGAASEWRAALETFEGRKAAVHMALVAHCAELFAPRELVTSVLPESGSLAAFLPHIWRAQKNTSLLPLIGQFAANQQ